MHVSMTEAYMYAMSMSPTLHHVFFFWRKVADADIVEAGICNMATFHIPYATLYLQFKQTLALVKEIHFLGLIINETIYVIYTY